MLGLSNSHLGVHVTSDFLTQVEAFPIGIEPERFAEALQRPTTKEFVKQLREQFRGCKIIVGIDRLDYIKGIPHKIYALERFFVSNPEWIGKAVLVQVAVPSRSDVAEYQHLARQTHELVGRVNGRFGSLTYVPIYYLDQSIPFDKVLLSKQCIQQRPSH